MTEQTKFTQEQSQQIEAATLGSKISLNLTVREVNVILGLLGKYPFEEVNQLVSRIQEEGQPQVRKLVGEIEEKVLSTVEVEEVK